MGTGEEVWSLDTVEVSNYFAHFHTLCPSGSLPKANGKKFFGKLNVPPTSLSLLWNLSDVDRDGFLNAAEFCVAMHLTKQYFDGTPLPKTLPLPLKLYAKQAIKLPVSNESQKDRCLEIFEQSKNYVHEGILEGKIAKFLLSKSKLESSQLFHIWNLADVDQDGGLTLEEFRLAIHLISLAKRGVVLPTSVKPKDLLPSSFFETEAPKESKEALEQREDSDRKEEDLRQGDKDVQQQTDRSPEQENNHTSFTHQPLPLSPSWTNFEDSKFDGTDFTFGFPSSLSPIVEEESALVSDKQHLDPFTVNNRTVTDSPIGDKQVVSEEDESFREEDNPFRKDSFVGLESTHCDTVENSSVTNTQSITDSFCAKIIESADKIVGSCDHSTDSREQEQENPFRKDSFVLLQEEQLASTKGLVNNAEHTAESSLNTVVENSPFHDPFLQSDPFKTEAATKSSFDKDTLDSLPEEEPRSKFQLITPYSQLVDLELADSVPFVPFEYDPFEEEPFLSEQKVLLESSVEDKESCDSNTQWHQFDSFDHSFDPHFDTFDHNFGPSDSLFSAVDNHLEPFVDQPVDLDPPVDLAVHSKLAVDHPVDLDPPIDLDLDNSLDKMAVDANAIPDIQDLDNAFSLDDLTSVITEMELVTESLNEEPAQTPPAVAKKPKKSPSPSVTEKPKKVPPPVPTKKSEKKPFTTNNEQSTKKPQSFLNEVNVQKSKEKAQQIDIDIAGDVFSELEAQLQQELLAGSDQVPDEVKEVLKELNAPYTMGLENIEVELGVKSDDSHGNVGDLISELHGMGDFENLDDEEEEPQQNGDEPVSELAESGLADTYADASMDDLLSELKGMEDRDQKSSLLPPTLPKSAKEKTPTEEDLLGDFDLNLDDELASITNTISGFSVNPPPASQQQEVDYNMTEVSYQEALVEHRWKKIEKEQNRRDREASEVEQLNQESDMAMKSLDEEMQSLLSNNQSSNNNTGEVMVLRRVKVSTSKELKPARRKSSLAEMWEEAVAQRVQESKTKRQSTGVDIVKIEREEVLSRELELQKERKLRQTSSSTDS